MKSVRTIVNARMKELGLNAYGLAMLVKGQMSPQTVYNFVKGRGEMNTRSLAYVLDVLDLSIVGGNRLILDDKPDTTSVRADVSKRKPTGPGGVKKR